LGWGYWTSRHWGQLTDMVAGNPTKAQHLIARIQKKSQLNERVVKATDDYVAFLTFISEIM